ncbi:MULTISPECIES: LytTR family DNA-binding domain-containing protein [unclassified Brevundimonas]|uniref:LytTR family DNA-binding domain-containing protein n=1 Tax=unclassified Brevundimonas TaxID=2622653 RepID=UPI0006F52658|nr:MULTISPECIES: LytTR family DNA-binding domain-containing protein [unclassified Brevundimonas]KQY88080.1 histidine kinase [Brevundimonas sp. Root1423]KRA28622.1 histidine kinase [Brevundimonas sp. Root608]
MSASETGPDVVRIAIDRRLLRGIAVALAGGVLLALTGAFGMHDVSLGFRLTYWLPVMLMGALWGHLCSRLVERRVDIDARPWLAVAALTVVISGPLAVMVWAVTGWFFDDDRSVTLARLPDFLGPVLVVTGTLSALNVFLGRTPVQTHAAAAGAKPARFLDRVPFRLRGAVIRAVQSEDHYLRLHTDRGSDLILMRLSDALAELEGLEGAQTHRSWWVAKDAVRGVSRRDGRATLTLEGGLEAPVSRRYARALREAGWY